MKKILALALSSVLVISGAAAFAACTTAAEEEGQKPVQEKLYFVPGTYMSDGVKVENTLSDGATKLSDDKCAEMNTENVYQCTLSAGANLPVPTSQRKDKDDNLYTFNGWWTIVNATVTYYETVPTVTETTFLYADWRADLSQRKDPIVPDESTTVQPLHYMSIKRAKTGEEEKVVLRVSGTDVSAETLGYGRPVQLYNGWFELNPGDIITVYTAGLGESTEAQIAPLDVAGRGITLENNGEGTNITANYLTASITDGTMTYRKSLKKRHFRIYIKFQSAGAKMTVYMEPMD
ncbi:MAG: hypothetical protein K2O28_06585 [Clostridia bacterium]|nr:hypothetical protein [Clostridia bacterium]